MAIVWLQSALWLGLALGAALISIRVAISVALIEIVVGAVAGNLIGLQITDWVNFLAGFGAILLTFLAGTEIDPGTIRKHFWSSMTIGVVGFFAPYLGCADLRAFRQRLALAAGADRWHFPFDDFGCGRLCGDDRDRIQQH
jgi:Kef-type K+ transport system membrane component KefB